MRDTDVEANLLGCAADDDFAMFFLGQVAVGRRQARGQEPAVRPISAAYAPVALTTMSQGIVVSFV